jgi:hypothetical protein
VAEMLGKYDAVFIAPPNETSPEDLQAFDMSDYIRTFKNKSGMKEKDYG